MHAHGRAMPRACGGTRTTESRSAGPAAPPTGAAGIPTLRLSSVAVGVSGPRPTTPRRSGSRPPEPRAQPCAGVSFQRGAFKFVPGQWHSIQLTVLLNTPNKTNGLFQLDVNGETAIRYSKMNWRLYGEGRQCGQCAAAAGGPLAPPFARAWRLCSRLAPSLPLTPLP